MSETTPDNSKTIGIVAYLTLIGWIVAFIMHNNNKSEYSAFHVRQGLGLMILYIVVWIINFAIAMAGIPFVGYILLLGIFVLWLLGFIGAVQGEKKLVPGIGQMFQDWFKGIQ